jgi:exo-beta-1,3-glucanase (GH17 family)
VFDILGVTSSASSAGLTSASPASKRKASSSSSSSLVRGGMDVVVYDDHSCLRDLAEPGALVENQENTLCAVLSSLLREGRDVHVLEGEHN